MLTRAFRNIVNFQQAVEPWSRSRRSPPREGTHPGPKCNETGDKPGWPRRGPGSCGPERWADRPAIAYHNIEALLCSIRRTVRDICQPTPRARTPLSLSTGTVVEVYLHLQTANHLSRSDGRAHTPPHLCLVRSPPSRLKARGEAHMHWSGARTLFCFANIETLMGPDISIDQSSKRGSSYLVYST